MTARDRLAGVLSAELLDLIDEVVDERVAAALADRNGDGAKRWLTPREAGVHLGCSGRAVYERIRKGRIPAEAVKHSGRRVYVDRRALDRALERSL